MLNRHGNAMDANAGNTVRGMRKKVLTMAEYIKREAAIRALLNDSPEQVRYSREDAADCIRYLDSADVAPVRWLPVVGYEGLYEVNQWGQIRNKDGRIMRQRLKRAKYTVYKKVSLYKNGEYKHLYVHRIVAQAFIPNPKGFEMINHKDEDGTNNVVDNLEWCDRSYNATYGSSPKKISKAFKGRESEKRIAVYAMDKSGNIFGEWDSITAAAKDIGCSTSEISGALKGKRKTVKGLIWNYCNCGAKMDRKEGEENEIH